MPQKMPLPYMPDFKPVINTYVLHNATPEEIVLKWGGLQMTVPPTTEIGPRAAKFPDGSDIPGTRTISDTYTAFAGGQVPRKGDPPNWFAAAAIKNILKIDADSGEATGSSAMKGVSVLPAAPSVTMIAQAQADGKQRYDAFLVRWATDCVNGYQVARERNQQAGYAAPPPGEDYQRAIILLEKSHKAMKKDMGIAEDLVIGAEDTDEELEAWILSEAMKRAKEPADEAGIDQAALAAKLLENPKIRQSLRKKGLRIRKVGHTEEGSFTPPNPGGEAA